MLVFWSDMPRPVGVLAAALVAAAIGLGACAPAAQPTPTSPPPKTAPTAAPAAKTEPAAKPTEPAAAKPAAKVDYKAEMDRLYEAAKREGKLVLYSSMNLDDARVILPQFEQAFPGVKIEHVRATGETLQQRLVTEVRAGRVLADVFDTNAGQVLPVVEQGLLEEYPVPTAQDIPAEFRDPRGRWTTERVTTVIIAYNTNMVRPNEAPQTFEDLADPKWKGKILMEAADQEMMITLLKQKFGDEQKGLEVFRKIAANEPEVHSGHTQVADMLAAGQGAICMGCYGHHIVALKEKGTPLATRFAA